MKKIKLYKGTGKPVKIDVNKLCIDYIKNSMIKITPAIIQPKKKITFKNIPQPTQK